MSHPNQQTQIVPPWIDTNGVVKTSAGIGKDDRLPTRYDARDASSDNVTNDELELFPKNPTTGVHRNYTDNPPEASKAKRIVGLGLMFTPPLIYSETNIDPAAIVQAIKHTAIVLSIGDQERKKLRTHTSTLINWARSGPIRDAYDNGTNSDSWDGYFFKSGGAKPLQDPFAAQLDAGERFHLNLHFEGNQSLPSDSDWSGANQVPLKVVAVTQFVHA